MQAAMVTAGSSSKAAGALVTPCIHTHMAVGVCLVHRQWTKALDGHCSIDWCAQASPPDEQRQRAHMGGIRMRQQHQINPRQGTAVAQQRRGHNSAASSGVAAQGGGSPCGAAPEMLLVNNGRFCWGSWNLT
jgi:hypothetical protein